VNGGGAVKWSVDGIVGGSSAVGTISTDGLYTPPLTEGTHSIVATSVLDTSKIGAERVNDFETHGFMSLTNEWV